MESRVRNPESGGQDGLAFTGFALDIRLKFNQISGLRDQGSELPAPEHSHKKKILL